MWIWVSLYYGSSKGGGLVALVPINWLSRGRHRASPAQKVGNLQLQSPSACVKGGKGSQHPYRGSPETSSHPGLAASVHEDARKLGCELCFSGDIERSQSTHSHFCCLHAAANTSRASKSVWGSSSRVTMFNVERIRGWLRCLIWEEGSEWLCTAQENSFQPELVPL